MAGKRNTFLRVKTDFEKETAYKWCHTGNKRLIRSPPEPGPNNYLPESQSSILNDFLSSETSEVDGGPDAGGITKNELQIQNTIPECENKTQDVEVSPSEDTLQIINLSAHVLTDTEKHPLNWINSQLPRICSFFVKN